MIRPRHQSHSPACQAHGVRVQARTLAGLRQLPLLCTPQANPAGGHRIAALHIALPDALLLLLLLLLAGYMAGGCRDWLGHDANCALALIYWRCG